MLYGLFGNLNVERVLLFLFVNEKCYATQIQSLLGVPLTPIQKALLRLEKEKIVNSHYEGKVRIFRFNPYYPLYNELEMLLRKAYTLLPSQKKKLYCFIHKPQLQFQEELVPDRKSVYNFAGADFVASKAIQQSAEDEGNLDKLSSPSTKLGGKKCPSKPKDFFGRVLDRERTRNDILLRFWKRLSQVQNLSFSAKTRQNGQTHFRTGKANVQARAPGPSVLIFQEKGLWIQDQLHETAFSNSLRWSLDLGASLITLEHLRYGAERPVFLFHLTPIQPHILESVDAHLCGEDVYLGNITWNHAKIDFHWRIVGAYKNDYLMYCYT